MAEIKIEKKTPIWPWILALIVIAALAYYFFFRDKETENEVIEEVEETTSMTITPNTGGIAMVFTTGQGELLTANI